MNQVLPDPGRLAILLIFGAPFAVGALWIVVHAVTTVVNNWREVGLKTRMIDLGMSADEIERVMNAGRAQGNSGAAKTQPPQAAGRFGKFACTK